MADKTPEQIVQEAADKLKQQSDAAAAADAKDIKDNYYKLTLSSGLGMAGAVAGIIIAVKRKSGFWGGLGWFLLISAAGSATGYITGSVLDGRPKQQ